MFIFLNLSDIKNNLANFSEIVIDILKEHKLYVSSNIQTIFYTRQTNYMLLLPRLPQDLLAGCRPFHVHDCVDFTLGLPLASIEEGAFEGGLTSAIPGIMGILLTSTDFSVSNCCKHLLEQIKDWANKK